jgi:hypothetical protein
METDVMNDQQDTGAGVTEQVASSFASTLNLRLRTPMWSLEARDDFVLDRS